MELHDLIGTSKSILWWQMCVRATIIFVFGIALARLAGTRAFGKNSALDLLLAILLGSNLSRALTGNADLVATLVATALLVVLHTVLAWLSMRASWLGKAVKGRPIQIIRDGRVDPAAMRRALLTDNDLAEGLRGCGYEAGAEVQAAYLERSGEITVIR